MPTMRAAWYERQGAPADVLEVGTMERPEPGPGEVLVRVYASGVNPSDTYGRSGIRRLPMPFPRIVPHQDGAGVIEDVGEGVSSARIGERVWVYEATWNRPSGTAAEYTVVPVQRAVRLPDGASFEQGACLGVPAMTAHRAVSAPGAVRGKTVLVTGGAGSVGHLAIQVARWGGAARIISTVSSEAKAAVARAAGANEVLNYRETDVAAAIKDLTGGRGVDHIVEVDFGENLPTSVAVLAMHGTIASYASRGNPEPTVPHQALMSRNVAVHTVLVYSMPEPAKEAAMADITSMLEEDRLHSVVAETLPLERIAAAHETVEAWSAIGHLVLQV